MVLICVMTFIVGCRGIVQLGSPVFRYYLVVSPGWDLVSSVLFTIVPVSPKIKNTWFIFVITLYFTSLWLLGKRRKRQKKMFAEGFIGDFT